MSGQSNSQQHSTHSAVECARAEHYLLLSLVAFAASVIITRLYLQLLRGCLNIHQIILSGSRSDA